MEKPIIPLEIIKEIELQKPVSLKKTVTLIQDKKRTKQYSIKIPRVIIEEVQWVAGDKIDIEIEDIGLKLRKAQS